MKKRKRIITVCLVLVGTVLVYFVMRPKECSMEEIRSFLGFGYSEADVIDQYIKTDGFSTDICIVVKTNDFIWDDSLSVGEREKWLFFETKKKLRDILFRYNLFDEDTQIYEYLVTYVSPDGGYTSKPVWCITRPREDTPTFAIYYMSYPRRIKLKE